MTVAQRVLAAWDRFLFEPQQTSTLAILRIAFGLTVTVWTLCQLPTLFTFYAQDGVLPTAPALGPGAWGLLQTTSGSTLVAVVWLALLVGAVALTVGLQSRIAAVVVFLGLLSLERRNPFILNSGDILLRNMAFVLVFAPTGVALSVDRWRAHRSTFWEFPARAPWALRMLQIQLSVIYVSAAWFKLQGDQWRGGTAVTWALGIEDITRVPAPSFLTDSAVLTEMFTFGTIALELSLAILVWKRAARPWVLGLGVLMHVGIDLAFMVGFFSVAMLCLYLVFVPPDVATTRLLALRERASTRRGLVTSREASD